MQRQRGPTHGTCSPSCNELAKMQSCKSHHMCTAHTLDGYVLIIQRLAHIQTHRHQYRSINYNWYMHSVTLIITIAPGETMGPGMHVNDPQNPPKYSFRLPHCLTTSTNCLLWFGSGTFSGGGRCLLGSSGCSWAAGGKFGKLLPHWFTVLDRQISSESSSYPARCDKKDDNCSCWGPDWGRLWCAECCQHYDNKPLLHSKHWTEIICQCENNYPYWVKGRQPYWHGSHRKLYCLDSTSVTHLFITICRYWHCFLFSCLWSRQNSSFVWLCCLAQMRDRSLFFLSPTLSL